MAEESAPNPCEGDRLCGARILVAEDNRINRRVARAFLEKMGCGVDFAEDGEEAVEKVFRRSYGAVLMDCQMPRMDGFEAAGKIRERERLTGGRIPIIAMTAHALREDRERCLSAGMDDHIPKPVDAENLRECLLLWMGRKGREMPFAPRSTLSTVAMGFDPGPLRMMMDLQSQSGSNLMREVLERFFAETPRRISVMREALDRLDCSEIGNVAHTLRGSSATLGAAGVASTCGMIEKAAESQNLKNAFALLQSLEKEFSSVKSEIEEEVKRLVGSG